MVVTDRGVLRLFPNCVESIVRARKATTDLELVVADWESDDWPLEEWLTEVAYPVPVRVLTLSGTFSRGRGLNAAKSAAGGEYLFFIDSDALILESVVRRGIQIVQQRKAYFPILYSYTDPKHQNGYWRDAGFGHCMLSIEMFDDVGGWPEYNSWGREDVELSQRVAERFTIVRERTEGLFHQWHPDDIDFKNRYGEEDDAVQNIRAKAEQAKLEERVADRLRMVLRRGVPFILVDEDRTDIKAGVENRSVPFLERSGRYWGPPSDDAQAVCELERLRRDGAEFIVFPWLACWWLQHYHAFAKHLEKTALCVVNDELMTIYDLKHSNAASSADLST
jgi:glycosyltransferase involved in cell wall biosynthesis